MKVLLDSYDKVMQNPAGGVQMRIGALQAALGNYCEVKVFDKWNDKLSEYDVLHVFRAGVDRYDLIETAKTMGLKVVISPIIPDDFNRTKVFLNKMLYKLPIASGYKFIRDELNMADVLLPQNNIEKNNIVSVYQIDANKIKVMPNGCSLDFSGTIDDSFPNKYKISKPYVLCVGRIDRNKNQLNLINALSETDVQLVLIGGPDPHDQEYYDECVRCAGDRVIFAGWISHSDLLLKSAYQNAQVVCLPSFHEIFGNSYVEGGCAGANLAVTNTLPTVNEFGLSEFTYVFNPADIDDIKKNVLAAYYQEKNENNAIHFKNVFSWDKIAQAHFQIYKNC